MRLELRPHAPQSRALPTALHPDIQFFCMIPREEEKSKFFVSVGSAVVKPDFAGIFQPGNFRRKLLSQRLPGSCFQGNGWVVYPPKAGALPTALHPDIQFFCMIPREEGKSKFFVSVGSAVVKPGFAGGSSGGGFPPQATVPRTSRPSLFGEWIGSLSSQSKRATNCATPG